MAEMPPEAFEREARRIRPAMLSLARRITGSPDDAADVVQESLLKLWFFRNRLSDYRTVDAPAMVIVRRLSLNHIRSRMLTVEPEASMAAQEPGFPPPSRPCSGCATLTKWKLMTLPA